MLDGRLEPMYLLAIDTATNSGGAALSRNREVIGTVMLKTPLRYAEKILYYVDFLLAQHHLQLSEIDCFAAATGPGSFTGLRIGLATVKAFCQSLSRPAIGICTLEALAYRFRALSPLVAPMMDARRQQIYGALYHMREGVMEVVRQPEAAPPAAWLKRLPAPECLFVGDGSQLYRTAILAARPQARILATDNMLLCELCELAYLRFAQGQTVTAEQLKANYVRPSDAELNRAPSS